MSSPDGKTRSPENPRAASKASTSGSGASTTPAHLTGSSDIRDLVPAPLFCCDGEGRFVWVNRAAELLSGYSAHELLGQSFVALIAPAKRKRLTGYFLRQQRRGVVDFSHDVPLVTRDGRVAWVALHVHRAQAPNGKWGYVGCAHDLHRVHFELESLKRRVRQLTAVAEEATDAARIKGEFLAAMSHEIRTPMSGVIGMTRMLLESNLDRDQRSFVEVIQGSSEALIGIINDLLDFSKIEAGRLEVESLDFDLRVTMDGIAKLLAPRAEEKKLGFVSTVHHQVPAQLRGDPWRLRQVLSTLAGNALRFTDQGEVVMRVDLVEETPSLATLRFAVSDTGAGLDEHQLTSLIQAYREGDVSAARRFGGPVLGLAISRRLITLMGGEVGVESQPGKGNIFWFRVPLVKQLETAEPPQAPDVELRGMRVLVADASHSMRMALTEILTMWGCSSDEVEDGESALAALSAGARLGMPYRVALIDMQLPGLDGEALAQAIRADRALDDTLMMLLTGLGRRGDTARAQALGYSAYLLKPVQHSHLYDALIEVVHRGPRTRSDAEAALATSRTIVTRHSVAEQRRQRTRVLVVDDNAVNQLVAIAALRRAGYRTEMAPSGGAAIETHARQPFDAILMDVQMPEMDGYQATAEIRRLDDAAGRHTPIIALTAHSLPVERERCLAASMDDYLSKPVDLEAMCMAVDRWTRPEVNRRKVEVVAGSAPAAVAPAVATPPADPVAPGARFLEEADEEPVLDEARLSISSMNSAELRSVLLQAFQTHARPRLNRLRERATAGDAHGVEFEAHGLKGMCATLGAARCASLFGRMERLGREQRLEPVAPMVERADIEVGRVEALIAPPSKAA